MLGCVPIRGGGGGAGDGGGDEGAGGGGGSAGAAEGAAVGRPLLRRPRGPSPYPRQHPEAVRALQTPRKVHTLYLCLYPHHTQTHTSVYAHSVPIIIPSGSIT